MKTVAITGHTQGIGIAMAEYFRSKGYTVVGFSRQTGYDINKEEDRARIIEEAKSADIFVNNAYDLKGNSQGQNLILYQMTKLWANENKTLINISSIGGDFPESAVPYNINKNKQDQHLKVASHTTTRLHTINLKPFWTNTDWVNANWPDIAKGTYNWPNIGKVDVPDIIKTLDFILSNADSMRITEISIYPKIDTN